MYVCDWPSAQQCAVDPLIAVVESIPLVCAVVGFPALRHATCT